jgi:hypothetical protein
LRARHARLPNSRKVIPSPCVTALCCNAQQQCVHRFKISSVKTTDGQLRHPSFQGLWRDKDPAEVVREML